MNTVGDERTHHSFENDFPEYVSRRKSDISPAVGGRIPKKSQRKVKRRGLENPPSSFGFS